MTVTIPVKCVACGADYSVQDDKAGRKFRCKYCEAVVEVPPAAPPPAVPPPGMGVGGGTDQPNPFEVSSSQPSVSASPSSFDESGGSFADNDPYAPKPQQSQPQPYVGPPPESQVQLPAIFMIVLGGLSMPFCLLAMVNQLAQAGRGRPAGEALVGGVMMLGVLVLSIIVIVGGINLMKLKNKTMAMMAAIICCIPCCGPCVIFSIPFGIWSLVVMNDPQVSRAFKS